MSCEVYVPLELSHLVVYPTGMNLVILEVNVAVVAYMVVRLRRRRDARAGMFQASLPRRFLGFTNIMESTDTPSLLNPT